MMRGALPATIFATAVALGGAAWAETSNWLQATPAGDWSAMSMRDRSVKDRNGEEIGKITDFLVGRKGEIHAAIIDISGLAGKQDTRIAVPFDQLDISVSGAANAEDMARGGTAPKIPSEPHLSGAQGGSAAGEADAMKKIPGAITIQLSKQDIRNAPHFEGRP